MTGPVSHDILLRDGGKPAGRVQFDLEMEQYNEVVATFREVQVSSLDAFNPDGSSDPYLLFNYSGGSVSQCIYMYSPVVQQGSEAVQVTDYQIHSQSFVA